MDVSCRYLHERGILLAQWLIRIGEIIIGSNLAFFLSHETPTDIPQLSAKVKFSAFIPLPLHDYLFPDQKARPHKRTGLSLS